MPPIVKITRRAEFSASHRLANPKLSGERNQAIYGKCANENGHGHNYVLEVTLAGSIDPETGMLIDLKELKELLEQEVVGPMDHKHLNHDVPFLRDVIPTAENLVVAIWRRLARRLPDGLLERVRLWETPRNHVDFQGEGV